MKPHQSESHLDDAILRKKASDLVTGEHGLDDFAGDVLMAVLLLVMAEVLVLLAELDIREQWQSQQNEEVRLQSELFGTGFEIFMKMVDDSVILEESLVEIGLDEQDLFELGTAIDHVTECSQRPLYLSFADSNPISFEEAFQNPHKIMI